MQTFTSNANVLKEIFQIDLDSTWTPNKPNYIVLIADFGKTLKCNCAGIRTEIIF